MTYGDFDPEPIEAGADVSDMRTDRRADRLILEPNGSPPNVDGLILASVSLLTRMIDVAAPVSRSVAAARVMEHEPCRVTTLRSRTILGRLAGREAGSVVR